MARVVAEPILDPAALATRLAVNREIRRGSGDRGQRPGEMPKNRKTE